MKVDRLISIKLQGPEKITVPKGEMWKLIPYGETTSVNGKYGDKGSMIIAVENDVITIHAGSNSNNAYYTVQLSGLAFTI